MTARIDREPHFHAVVLALGEEGLAETAATLAGGMMLAAAHLGNWRYRRRVCSASAR